VTEDELRIGDVEQVLLVVAVVSTKLKGRSEFRYNKIRVRQSVVTPQRCGRRRTSGEVKLTPLLRLKRHKVSPPSLKVES
jgi:hypothetical protein